VDVTYLASETLDSIKVAKLELVPKDPEIRNPSPK